MSLIAARMPGRWRTVAAASLRPGQVSAGARSLAGVADGPAHFEAKASSLSAAACGSLRGRRAAEVPGPDGGRGTCHREVRPAGPPDGGPAAAGVPGTGCGVRRGFRSRARVSWLEGGGQCLEVQRFDRLGLAGRIALLSAARWTTSAVAGECQRIAPACDTLPMRHAPFGGGMDLGLTPSEPRIDRLVQRCLSPDAPPGAVASTPAVCGARSGAAQCDSSGRSHRSCGACAPVRRRGRWPGV